jgi:hypothetical protein
MMKRLMKPTLVLLLLALALLFAAATALAQAEDEYDLSWFTVDDGGGVSRGGEYVLSGSIGQPDVSALAEGEYALWGGFWVGGYESYEIYLPVVLRWGS